MNCLDKVIMFLACLAEVFMIYDYFRSFFDLKLKREYVRICCVGTVLVLFLINAVQNGIVNLIFVPILFWLFASILFDAKPGVRFGYFFIAYAVMIGVEFFYIIWSETTVESVSRTGLIRVSEYAWQLILIKFLNYIVFLILKQSSAKSKRKMTNKLFLIYMCVPFTTLGTMITVFYSGVNFDKYVLSKVVMTFFFVCMLAGNMLFFYVFQKYAENLNETHIQQMEIVYNKAEIKRLSQISELNEDFNEILHNTTHYLKMIRELAYENRNKEICDMVDNLSGKLKRENVYEYSHHRILNTILSEYNDKAYNIGIEFDAYVEPGCILEYVQDIDLISMLGNMFDNAILAASKKENGAVITVRIFMQKDGKLCVIKVVNDFTGEIKEDKGKLLSTKKESGIHGIGISSISKMAEKYGGYMEHYKEECKFNAILVLPVPVSK